MAELAIECPTPDGHIDFSNGPPARSDPPTNLRIREFLKKQHGHRSPAGSAVDSENSSDDQQRQLANNSPPPNCSICLGRIKSKCFTDSCMHQFCFSCLLEWSKVKPECPLCKQTFKSIIHNVTSMDSYDEYKVEAQQRHVNWINLHPFQGGNVDVNFLISAASIPTYQVHRRDYTQSTEISRRRLYQLFRQDSPLVQRFAQTYPNEVYPNRISTAQWREYIYNRRLYAEPLNDLSGAHREISAEFYRANPAQMQRLIPWLHRELLCLCGDPQQTHNITYLVQRIHQLIQEYDMTSFDFLSRVRALVPNHTEHFTHELINYARSPYDLVGYDRIVTYLPRFESDINDVVTLSSSEEGSDIEFVGPVVDVETIDINSDRPLAAQNQNSNGSVIDIASNSGSGSSSSSSFVASAAGASTSGIQSTATTASQNKTTVTHELNLLVDDDDDDIDSDEEEEIKHFLQAKSNITEAERILGRQGPTPKNDDNTNGDSGSSCVRIESSNSGHQISEDSQRALAIEPEPIEGTSANQPTDAGNRVTPKVEPNNQSIASEVDAAAAETATAASVVPEIIDADSGSDSDECLFVCAKKPPHLRTPEYVELNSDSDSDVVYVSSEVCEAPSTPNIANAIANNVRLEVLNEMEKAIINTLSAVQHSDASTNSTARRKRGRNNTESVTSNCAAGQNATQNVYEAKPSTSETMLHWLIQPSDEHSRRISPRSSSNKQQTPSIRPRLTTTIKISRGKRIYESPSSDDATTDSASDRDTSSSSSTNSDDTTDTESSSHEEFVCSNVRGRKKRTAINSDGPSLAPRRKYRKRRAGKRMYESSEDSDDEDDGTS